ncbi:DoxX family protein [Flavobacterium sp. F-65]|jgi:putative oxidoreductase|uniref:DoxX family protein n=1 Tax=Flavobacterium pisciphilum TaxID=2893755 RepID=A0ABS8MNN4_9FLAO|nr:DoxX family protein [Flavobacterium sp. F-65]MCC9070370.1 DoxX family protein [Flavobacterium sp. F-65]
MKNTQQFAQIFLRLALGIGFILPVMDRLGMLGAAGEPNVGWGNWANFVDYTNSLMPYLNHDVTNVMAIIATLAEIVFGILLIIGFKIKTTAYGSFLLTLSFALSMLIFAGYRAPFNYSVFTASAASLLLASIPFYNWSIDKLIASKK